MAILLLVVLAFLSCGVLMAGCDGAGKWEGTGATHTQKQQLQQLLSSLQEDGRAPDAARLKAAIDGNKIKIANDATTEDMKNKGVEYAVDSSGDVVIRKDLLPRPGW
jgi:hypothetical protein